MKVCSILSFWSIALLCSFINLIHLGLKKIMGLQFVASIERYNASREQSAFSMLFGWMIFNIFGPVVGFLGTKFGIKNVTMCGCVIASFSLAACFFGESITFITLCWGIPLGVSTAMSTNLLPSLLHTHFKDDKAVANGIALVGPCLGGIGFSPLYKLLLDVYGVSGSFLIFGAIALHSVPAAMLLVNTKPDTREKESKTEDNKDTVNINNDHSEKLESDKYNLRSIQDVLKHNSIAEISLPEKDLNFDNSPNGNIKEIVLVSNVNIENIEFNNYHLRNNQTEIRRYIDEEESKNILPANDDTQQKIIGVLTNTKPLQVTETNDTIYRNFSKQEASGTKAANTCSISENLTITNVDTPHTINRITSNTKPLKVTETNKTAPRKDSQNENSDIIEEIATADTSTTLGNSIANTTTNYDVPQAIIETLTSQIPLQDTEKIYTISRTKQKNLTTISTTNNETPHAITKTPTSIKSLQVTEINDTISKTTQENSKTCNWDLFRVLYDPLFLLVSFIISSHMFTMVVVTTVLVDFAIDKGLSVNQGVYMLMCLNISDMIGRFSLGWITDKGYVSVTNFAALCYFILAICVFVFVVINNFYLLLLSLAAVSFFMGALMAIFNVIVSEYYKGDMNTMAIASKYFIMIPVCLVTSPMIGFFRENLGSYALLFYFISGICILCCIIILLLPTVAKFRKQNLIQKVDE